jgi:hypothetical protein
MAFVACPSCGATTLRTSRIRTAVERVQSLVGFCPFRCRVCSHRFTALVWDFSTWRYARCPKCLRTELSTWSEQYYNPAWRTTFLLKIGATPYRCEFCRCNFASFLACKERFSWRRRRAQAAVAGAEPRAAGPPEPLA